MIEGMLQLVAEVLLQALAELLIELGLHSVAESFERRPSPGLAAVGYAIVGALLGGVSLWLLPQHLTATFGARLAALMIAPLVAGGFWCVACAPRRPGVPHRSIFLRLPVCAVLCADAVFLCRLRSDGGRLSSLVRVISCVVSIPASPSCVPMGARH
ncbi:hypothetical protein HZS92_02903 [Xanthomonas citri pv. citri]|nr:hypothetical protein HZS92_02903 [Xanthomonas citri pv. citri]